MKYILIIPTLICLLSIPLLLPLVSSPHIFNAQDSETYVCRGAELCNFLKEKIAYARWCPNFSYGHGYPFLNFYAPLSCYLIAFFHLILGFSIINATKMLVITIIFLQAFGMYFLARNFFSRSISILCVTAAIYTPYFINDIYIRADFSEALAYSLIPIVLHQYLKLIRTGNRKYLATSSLTFALLIFSSNTIALLMAGFLIIFILFFSIMERNWYKFAKTTVSYLLGLMLSAIFWLPALIEKKYVCIERTINEWWNLYFRNFKWSELFTQQWSMGTRGWDVNFQIGWLHIAIFVVAVVILIAKRPRPKHHLVYFILATCGAVFLITKCSDWLWRMVPITKFIQFPWRILTIVGICTSFLFGSIQYLQPKIRKIIIPLIILAILLFYGRYLKTWGPLHLSEDKFKPEHLILQDHTSVVRDEYLPVWVIQKPQGPNDKVTVACGRATISGLKTRATDYDFNINCEEDTEVILTSYWFPGWKCYLDNKPHPIMINKPDGRIRILIPEGIHQIRVRFQNSPIRTLAQNITITGIVMCLLLLFPYGKKLRIIMLVVLFIFSFSSSASAIQPAPAASPLAARRSLVYLPNPKDSLFQRVIYLDANSNSGTFRIKPGEKKHTFLISPYPLENVGISLTNEGQENICYISFGKEKRKINLAPHASLNLTFSHPKTNFREVNYFYEFYIKAGNTSTIWGYLSTDSYKIALKNLEKGAYQSSVNLLKNTIKKGLQNIEAYFFLGTAYQRNGNWQEALNSFQKGYELNSSYLDLLDPNIKSLDSVAEGLKIIFFPWDQFHNVGTIEDGATYFDPKYHRLGTLCYGPYVRFPKGGYQVEYLIQTEDNQTNTPLVKIDVAANSQSIIEKKLAGPDFPSTEKFHSFWLKFYNRDSSQELEFRIEALEKVKLWVNEITVVPDIRLTLQKRQAEFLHSWGLAYEQAGSFQKASEKFYMAARRDPENIEYRLHLAKFLESNAKFQEACAQYETIIKYYPNHYESILKLIGLYSKLSMPDKVSPLKDKLLFLTPQHPVSLNFNNRIEFLGYSIDKEKIPPGESFQIKYFWKILNPEPQDYIIPVHFIHNDKIRFQNDHNLEDQRLGRHRWIKGEILVEKYEVQVPISAEPGVYNIEIMFIDTRTEKPIEIAGKKRIKIGKFYISSKSY